MREPLGRDNVKRVLETLLALGTRNVLIAAASTMAFVQPAFVMAQAAPATIHGKVTDPAGNVLRRGEIKLSTDKAGAEKDRKYQFTFPIDGEGNFKGPGITPGDYIAFVSVDGKTPDYLPVLLKAGEDRTLDFDMTRAEYMKALTPEARAAIEANKKNNAGVTAENAKIANINQALAEARANVKAGKPDDAVKSMQELTQQRPTEAVLWATLAEAQLASGDVAMKAARTAKTSLTDSAILQKYSDAATSYQKAIETNAASKKPNPEIASASYMNMGQAFGKSGKTKEANDAYESAIKASPTAAGTAYYNEAAVFYNAGKLDEAGAAADKAIAADPKRAEAYYIKGQSLIPKASIDPKTQKIQAPPGCVEAYQSYLELAPEGAHAADVKGILMGIGATVKSSYKAGKK